MWAPIIAGGAAFGAFQIGRIVQMVRDARNFTGDNGRNRR